MIVRSLGEGPDLALIHGWGFGPAVWASLVQPLAARCRVHLVSLSGYGAAPADGANFLDTAQALVDALPPRVALCGWSLGALLAQQAALLAPRRIARLALVAATPSFTQRADWTPAQAPALLESFMAAVAQDAGGTLQRFAALLNQGDAQARSLGRSLAATLASGELPDAATLTKGLAWLRDVDLRDHAPALTMPTLLIHGARDPLMPLAAAEWLAGQLPDARLETLAEAAHAPFLADPARFAERLTEFCHG